MDEQAIVGARAAVMVYDDENKKWVPSGTSTGVSKVHIYQHMTQNTFRVVGRKLHDHELVINCAIVKNLKYNKATPTFHQWRDTKQVYGLNFSSKEDAENFANSMLKVLDVLNVPMIMNGNSNNNQMNQNIISKQAQQPVYGHLTETQQQIIKQQQYQAPPEYSENIHPNNRTNGWPNQQQAQVQTQMSQPNSLDLNDWRQQQMQNDLNQLNLNGNLPVSMMNTMQPIYGHHRNSLPQQNSQQMQQNAQILNQQHQQMIQHQQNQQQINGLQQQMIPNLQQQQSIQSPPQQQPNNLAQQIQSPQSIPQINGQGLSQPPIQNNIPQIQTVSTQPSNIPVPPPPPPAMPTNNAPPPPPMPTNLTLASNKANQSGTSLSAALSNAKLKKTPNKDDTKEKQNVGGGMASMMDEMAKTLARRRAQAEGITSQQNGNCNNDENDSGRLRNGWDNKNKSSPNKDNDNSHSRLRSGSVDISNHLEQLDVEKLKQDIITEMKKEMNKIKLEIIEVIKNELNKN